MKKFRKIIDQYIMNIEKKWKTLPGKRQRILTKVFFTGYALLTICAILQIWLRAAEGKDIPLGGHIRNITTGMNMKTMSLQDQTINSHQKSRE